MNELLVEARHLQRRIIANPQHKLQIIQDFCDEKFNAGDRDSAELILIILNILMAGPPEKPEPVPVWFLPAGMSLIILFLMGIVILSMFGIVVPQEGKFALVAILALGSGMSSSSLGGKAAVSGKIPFLKDSPLAISATGGIAVMIIIFIIGYYYYIK